MQSSMQKEREERKKAKRDINYFFGIITIGYEIPISLLKIKNT